MTMFVHIVENIFAHFSLHIISKTLIVCGCSLANGRFSSLHRITIGLIFGDCLGHFTTLICFLLSHSFVALTVCCVLLSCWEIQKWPTLQCSGGGKDVCTQDCTLHVSLHPFVDDVKLSCALARQTPSNHNDTTFMHDGEEGVLGIIDSSTLSQNTLNCDNAKQLDFGFI